MLLSNGADKLSLSLLYICILEMYTMRNILEFKHFCVYSVLNVFCYSFISTLLLNASLLCLHHVMLQEFNPVVVVILSVS